MLALDRVDQYVKGHISAKDPPEVRGLSDDQLGWIDQWKARGEIQLRFNSGFFTSGDSREPEQAGIGAAIVGSFLTLLIVASLSFPIGVAAAIYLEEFAPPGRWTCALESP